MALAKKTQGRLLSMVIVIVGYFLKTLAGMTLLLNQVVD